MLINHCLVAWAFSFQIHGNQRLLCLRNTPCIDGQMCCHLSYKYKLDVIKKKMKGDDLAFTKLNFTCDGREDWPE